jgi:FtsZ-binding cell division protein ZapB
MLNLLLMGEADDVICTFADSIVKLTQCCQVEIETIQKENERIQKENERIRKKKEALMDFPPSPW